MTMLSALWLPILISAVAVFVLSSIIHMTPLWHKSDYPRYANEDRVLDALRPLGLPPGDYFMPRPASSAEMRSPEFQEKMKRGSVLMTVMPPWSGSMAGNLSRFVSPSSASWRLCGGATPPGAARYRSPVCRDDAFASVPSPSGRCRSGTGARGA
jgi:hypothetical protein